MTGSSTTERAKWDQATDLLGKVLNRREFREGVGFEHDFKATARRPDPVPYELGELVEHLAQGTLTPL